MIKENSNPYFEKHLSRDFCERYWYTLYCKHLIALECFLTNAASQGLTEI